MDSAVTEDRKYDTEIRMCIGIEKVAFRETKQSIKI